MEEEKLESNQQKRAREINAIAEKLNEIKVPVNCQVYSHGMKWSIRNIAFWESLKKKDKEFLNLINVE